VKPEEQNGQAHEGRDKPSNQVVCKETNKLLDRMLNLDHVDGKMSKNELEYLLKKRRNKIKKMIFFFSFCVLVAATFILALIATLLAPSTSALYRIARYYILQNDGHAALQTVIFASVAFIIITITQFIIKLFAKGESKRRRTIVILVASFVKYIGFIIILIALFGFWEVDPAILAAILAALGIAIGFGAQGVIGDLITGLFLIFENSIQVGDIITFNNFRGEVEEVGIRTTRIADVGGNVQVVTNSQLRAFVNMTMHRSFAVCDVVIEYGENIERVEKVIGDHLEVVAELHPQISEGPYYKGLVEFNEKGVALRIVAKCHESERLQLQRDLNRDFKLLFDKHGIKLAVPKVEIFNNHKL